MMEKWNKREGMWENEIISERKMVRGGGINEVGEKRNITNKWDTRENRCNKNVR